MSDGFVKPMALARQAGMSKDQLYGFIRRGHVAAVRVGRTLMVPRSEADAFLARVAAQPATPIAFRGYYCRDNPGGRCFCRCHATRRTNDQRNKPQKRWDIWKPQHDEAITALVLEGHHPEVVARIISERFAIPRSQDSVRRRLSQLGVSIRDGWYSRDDLAKMIGVHHRKIAQWEQDGLLPVAEYGRWRRIAKADVDAVVAAQAGLAIDPRRIRDPRLRSIAETSAIANRRRAAS